VREREREREGERESKRDEHPRASDKQFIQVPLYHHQKQLKKASTHKLK